MKLKRMLKTMILVILALLICMPVIMVVFGSLKSNQELLVSLSPILNDSLDKISWSILPLYPTLKHYVLLLFQTPQFFVVFWNSIKMVGCILVGQMIVGIPAAWAFARFELPGKRFLFTLYIILMLMPFQVMMLPDYLVLNKIHLMNTHAAVILPAIFSTFPVFLIYRSFRAIPSELIEAAQIDGAGDWIIFLHIGIPLGASGIFSALVLGFLDYWNMIEQPLAFLKDKTLWPLSLYLPEIDTSQAGIALASSVITLIPAVFVFVLGQDYLEQGIVSSGLKE